MIRKNVGWIVGLMCFGLAVCSNTRGAERGLFVFGGAGLNLLNDIELPAGPTGTLDLESEPGFRLSVGVGNTFFSNETIALAVAAESGFLYNSLDRGLTGAGPTAVEGDFLQAPFLGKFVFKFMPESRFSPFLGLGCGALYSRLEVERIGSAVANESDEGIDPAV